MRVCCMHPDGLQLYTDSCSSMMCLPIDVHPAAAVLLEQLLYAYDRYTYTDNTAAVEPAIRMHVHTYIRIMCTIVAYGTVTAVVTQNPEVKSPNPSAAAILSRNPAFS